MFNRGKGLHSVPNSNNFRAMNCAKIRDPIIRVLAENFPNNIYLCPHKDTVGIFFYSKTVDEKYNIRRNSGNGAYSQSYDYFYQAVQAIQQFAESLNKPEPNYIPSFNGYALKQERGSDMAQSLIFSFYVKILEGEEIHEGLCKITIFNNRDGRFHIGISRAGNYSNNKITLPISTVARALNSPFMPTSLELTPFRGYQADPQPQWQVRNYYQVIVINVNDGSKIIASRDYCDKLITDINHTELSTNDNHMKIPLTNGNYLEPPMKSLQTPCNFALSDKDIEEFKAIFTELEAAEEVALGKRVLLQEGLSCEEAEEAEAAAKVAKEAEEAEVAEEAAKVAKVAEEAEEAAKVAKEAEEAEAAAKAAKVAKEAEEAEAAAKVAKEAEEAEAAAKVAKEAEEAAKVAKEAEEAEAAAKVAKEAEEAAKVAKAAEEAEAATKVAKEAEEAEAAAKVAKEAEEAAKVAKEAEEAEAAAKVAKEAGEAAKAAKEPEEEDNSVITNNIYYVLQYFIEECITVSKLLSSDGTIIVAIEHPGLGCVAAYRLPDNNTLDEFSVYDIKAAFCTTLYYIILQQSELMMNSLNSLLTGSNGDHSGYTHELIGYYMENTIAECLIKEYDLKVDEHFFSRLYSYHHPNGFITVGEIDCPPVSETSVRCCTIDSYEDDADTKKQQIEALMDKLSPDHNMLLYLITLLVGILMCPDTNGSDAELNTTLNQEIDGKSNSDIKIIETFVAQTEEFLKSAILEIRVIETENRDATCYIYKVIKYLVKNHVELFTDLDFQYFQDT
jgi:hypothetical protein